MPMQRSVLFGLALLMPATLNSPAAGEVPAQKQIARLAESRDVHAILNWFRAHEADLRKMQMEMVAIPAPPFHEQKRAEWLKKRFISYGLENVEIDKIGNVTGLRHGTNKSAKLVVVSAHLDTVFPEGTPVNIREDKDKIFAPGISDNGAGLTAILAMAAAFHATHLHTEAGILFIGNVGEEGEGDLRGMRYIFNESKWKTRIERTLVLDGAGTNTVVTQALGSRRFEVTIHGPGGHSWTDFGTPNPIVILSRAIAAFSATDIPSDPKTSFNIGTIAGGTSVNSIPESATARVDIRSAASGEIDRLEQALRVAVQESVAKSQDANARKLLVTADIEKIGERPAAELPANARIYEVMRAVDAHLGLPGELRRASTDANIPLSLGREALSIGAGGEGGGAHTVHEWYSPTGRDLGLKRIALALLALAGVPE